MNKTYSEKTKYIAGLLVFLAASLFVASWYIQEHQEAYRAQLQINIAEQETRMTRLAELSDRNSVDSIVDKLVQDCELEDRARFDTLLSSLSQLNRTELLEIEQLFAVCGGYYAERKAVLIVRLRREFEVYQQLAQLLSLTDADTTVLETKLVSWEELVMAEEERSKLSTELVTIQGDIIDELIAGVGVDSETITEKLKEAQTTKDSLVLLDSSTDKLRSVISGI